MVKVFKYIAELDCFIVEPAYKAIADRLGLTEWSEVVWIGRLFLMDNDFGEHWFDNWDLRESLENRSAEFGYDTDDLLILDPDRLKNDIDGPCHNSQERLSFWKDVLKSLHLSYETLFLEARKLNSERKEYTPEDYISDLEERIKNIQESLR